MRSAWVMTWGLLLLGSAAACGPTPRHPPLASLPPPVLPTRPEATAFPPLFGEVHTLELELSAPLQSVFAERQGERTYHAARLVYRSITGRRVALEVAVKILGRSRAHREVCTFTPLELRFDPASVEGTIFAGQHELRMYTHCRPTREAEQRNLLEYLVYRTLNLLTDLSYRARLAHVTYIDTDRRRRALTRYAFFAEREGAMAARNGWQTLELPRVLPSQLEPNQLSVVEVFQYMVGNTDWSVLEGPTGTACCHNTQLIGRAGTPVIPVPYDFDATGVVNTPSAAPDPALGIRSVRTRLYRGICKHPGYLDQTLDVFRRRKGAIYSLYREQEGLNQRRRQRALTYFDEFYATIDDPERLRRELSDRCRQLP